MIQLNRGIGAANIPSRKMGLRSVDPATAPCFLLWCTQLLVISLQVTPDYVGLTERHEANLSTVCKKDSTSNDGLSGYNIISHFS